jgi:hypothetical protein
MMRKIEERLPPTEHRWRIRCPHCRKILLTDGALTPAELLWMHEYECSGIVLAY